MGTVSQLAPTAVEDDAIVFRLSDPDHGHADVKVWFDVELAPDKQGELGMAEVEGGWELRLDLPDLDCLEYLFDVDGTMAPDPGNPDQVEGAFGPHSWLPMPGYEPPRWLDHEAADGTRHRLTVGEIDVEVWEPAGHEDAPLPLLLVHDGAEMDAYGGVVRYAATRPPMRVGLLSPGSARDERYAANPAYAAALVGDVIPALIGAVLDDARTRASRSEPRGAGRAPRGVALPGCLLGAGAAVGVVLHARAGPAGGGLRPVRPGRRVRGVTSTSRPRRRSPSRRSPSPAGLAEENLANNRLMHTHLAELGVPVSWGEVRQGHTWMCWRDTLDPHLGDLLSTVWS